MIRDEYTKASGFASYFLLLDQHIEGGSVECFKDLCTSYSQPQWDFGCDSMFPNTTASTCELYAF